LNEKNDDYHELLENERDATTKILRFMNKKQHERKKILRVKDIPRRKEMEADLELEVNSHMIPRMLEMLEFYQKQSDLDERESVLMSLLAGKEKEARSIFCTTRNCPNRKTCIHKWQNRARLFFFVWQRRHALRKRMNYGKWQIDNIHKSLKKNGIPIRNENA